MNTTTERKQALKLITPKIPSIKSRILKLIPQYEKGLTVKNIANILKVKPQTVTGRLDELWDVGKVAGIETYSETRYIDVHESQQKDVATKRRYDKFKTWVNKGKNRYGDIVDEEIWEQIIVAVDSSIEKIK